MSLPFFESSRFKGTPVTLFRFQYGPGTLDVHAFTTAERAITFNGIDYRPVPMTHSRITANGTVDQKTVNVRTSHTNPIADLFRVYPPVHTISLIIYKGHASDPDTDFRAIWNGRVMGCGWEGQEAVLTCEPVSSMRHRPGLRRHYQYGCPHVLYGQGPGKCNAAKVDATFRRTVEAVDGASVTLASGWFDPALTGRFINGMLEWTDAADRRHVRTILRITDRRFLLLSGVPEGLIADMAADVIYGCAHTREACLDVHNNIYNFGGCAWIPTKNPIGRVNNYY